MMLRATVVLALLMTFNFSFAKTPTTDSFIPHSQKDVLNQYQEVLIVTLRQVIDLEKDESAKIEFTKNSKGVEKCSNGDLNVCEDIKKILETRSQSFHLKLMQIWSTSIRELNILTALLNKFPNQGEVYLQKSNLQYFVTTYKEELSHVNALIDARAEVHLSLACPTQADSCTLENNVKLLLLKHEILIEMHQKAIESLQNGHGPFMPQYTST